MTPTEKRVIDREIEQRAYSVDAFYDELVRLGWTHDAAREMTLSYFKGGASAG